MASHHQNKEHSQEGFDALVESHDDHESEVEQNRQEKARLEKKEVQIARADLVAEHLLGLRRRYLVVPTIICIFLIAFLGTSIPLNDIEIAPSLFRSTGQTLTFLVASFTAVALGSVQRLVEVEPQRETIQASYMLLQSHF